MRQGDGKDMNPGQYSAPETQRKGMNPLLALVAAVPLLGGIGYLYVQVDHLKSELAQTRTAFREELDRMRDTSNVNVQNARANIGKLSDELEAARRQAQLAAGQAKADATKHAEELAKQLSAEQAKQKQLQLQVKTELDEVKDTATTATAKLGEVSTEVGNVKTDVANTKTELDKTIADLKRVNGDLTGQGVLIATNGKELAALKARGERNYFEFNLGKTKEPQRVGDVALSLKKTDPKRNKFTVEVMADDKKFEKKDRNVNEPIQFYVSKSTTPYELVINDVKKDRISGYLSAPKVQTARN